MSRSASFDIDFGVPQTHRLRFTRDVLGPDQQTLTDLLVPPLGGRARVQFWTDMDVVAARPELPGRLTAIARRHADRLEQVGPIQQVPGGEAIKNDIHIIERMLKVMNNADLDRQSYVVVVGGGAVLDAVGFAAAIAHRGLRLVRLPTTTLAQADSGVGVKNAVNLFQKKNWIGTFAVPWGVVNDAELLKTLSDRDFRCGFSEAVKVALLKDRPFFEQICRQAGELAGRDLPIALEVIRDSAIWHLKHITQGGDPIEASQARPLDFGHWSAHKLEAMTDFDLRHGEAVSIGVAIDTVYSSRVHGLPREDALATLRCLQRLGLPISTPALQDRAALLAGIEEFRQHLGGRLTLTMLQGVGSSIDVHEVDQAEMGIAIDQVTHFSETAIPAP